jgi:hypothetical protein
MKKFKKRIDDSVYFGLSIFTVKFIAETYGLKTADEFVEAVYAKAKEVYGDFKAIKYPTYTEFIKK